MKPTIIIFGVISFIISLLYPFMLVTIEIAETIPYCDDCDWTPWWDYITITDIVSIIVIGVIGGLLGCLIGYFIFKLFKK